ncbi:MAG TPA: MEDS domain-containing protein [Rhizomicrobium sp.]|nr:MEDS domain-containing protein [Rhizomicrobium sp.]
MNSASVKPVPRHQCLIYSGPPSDQLKSLALHIRKRLDANYRCLYLNSPQMVAGIRGYLTSSGLDVHAAVTAGRLILSSDQDHLVHGVFDAERMLDMLKGEIARALADGYAGLWASGDMAWEFGPERDFGKLEEYERALEEIFRTQPALCGVCQYHADTLPDEAVKMGMTLHPGVYVNETLSRVNNEYVKLAAE